MEPTYRCAGRYCPGLTWRASDTRHPTSCVHPELADPAIRAAVDGCVICGCLDPHGEPATAGGVVCRVCRSLDVGGVTL